jgi:hypothetical protein
MFDFEDDYKKSRENKPGLLTDHLKDYGIETSNSILNVGGLFIVICSMVAKVILLFILRIVIKLF